MSLDVLSPPASESLARWGWHFTKREAQRTASELLLLTEVPEERTGPGLYRVRGGTGIGTQIYFPATKPGVLVLLIKMDPMYHFRQCPL